MKLYYHTKIYQACIRWGANSQNILAQWFWSKCLEKEENSANKEIGVKYLQDANATAAKHAEKIDK